MVGLAAEARIARRLGRPVAIGGGTADGARAASDVLLGQGCTGLISFGLAGGLDAALPPGALVVPSTVIAGGERYATDPGLSRLFGGSTMHSLLGADTIVASVEEKCRLRERTGAVAVDLESGAVARAASKHGIPFTVLRAICDPAARALPPAALAALNARGAIGVWRLVSSIAARPRQLPALLVLAADAAAARRSLVGCVRRSAQAAN